MSQTTGFAFSDRNTQNSGLKYTYTKVFYHRNFSSLVTKRTAKIRSHPNNINTLQEPQLEP